MEGGDGPKRPRHIEQRIEELGRLPGHLISLIESSEALQTAIQRAREAGAGSHGHFMVYGRDEAAVARKMSDASITNHSNPVLALARSIANWATGLREDYDVGTVRILYNSVGTPCQQWHVDYPEGDMRSLAIMIGITESTEDNCTEYAVFSDAGEHRRLVEDGIRAMEEKREALLRMADFEHCLKGMVLGDYGACLSDLGSVVHRRGENRSDYRRITLGIDLFRDVGSPFILEEDDQGGVAHIEGRKIDSVTCTIRQ